MLNSPEQLDGRRLLSSDLRIGLAFANEARYRVIQRTFGVSRNQANLATLVALGGLAEAMRTQSRKMRSAAGVPSKADNMIGLTLVSELLRSVGGASEDTALMGPLIALAIMGTGARAVTRRSAHGVYGSSHKMDVAFHHRYGYLVDPGHWRARRAQRQETQERAPKLAS
jgi:hypothetical protein